MSESVFSVIIYCEHSAESLSITLNGLCELDPPHASEVIVIDNGNGPNRREAISGAVNRGLPVRYFQLPGISKSGAWNLGVDESSAEFLALLDDDCIPPASWLRALSEPFDSPRVGIVGGSDRVPADAGFFERCMDYVLTSSMGTLGIRTGRSRVSRYYPRPWNMAVRKEALKSVGGFDESTPESPEVPMIKRLEAAGYEVAYQPEATIWHYRETNLYNFLRRDFELGRGRANSNHQPGVRRIYSVAALLTLLMITLGAVSRVRDMNTSLLSILPKAYAALLAISGVHAAIGRRSPSALVAIPGLLAMHHLAHIAGFVFGKLWKPPHGR